MRNLSLRSSHMRLRFASVMVSAWLGLCVASAQQQYVLTDIGNVGDDLLGAYGVNNAGQGVGSEAPISGQHPFPFLWTAASGRQILVNTNSSANSINSRGEVAGEASFSS